MGNEDKSLAIACAIYSLFLIFIGTFGNLISFVLQLRKPYRYNNTFILLSFLRVTDILTLYVWNFKHVTLPLFGFDYIFKNLALCKAGIFIQFFSLKLSAWLLVAIIIERCLNNKIKKWKEFYFGRKRVILLGIFVVLVVFVIDMPLIILNGYTDIVNGTEVLHCFDSTYFKLFPIWQQIHSVIYSFITSTIITIMCVLLLCNYYKTKYNQNCNTIKSFRSLDIRLLIMSVVFIVATLPSSIVGIYYDPLYTSESGSNLILITDILLFSYHSLNFFIFIFYPKGSAEVSFIHIQSF